jgi:uncharacterized protein (TIGR02452 family)
MSNAEFDLAKSQRTRQMNARKKSKRRPVREPNSTGNFSLANIFRDTVNVCDEMFNAARGNMPPPSLKLTHDQLDLTNRLENVNRVTQLEVRDVDVVELMREFCADASLQNPLMLNLASDMYPGGGVNSGKKAQEECIFRRTNAYMTHPLEWYPLQPTELIYSPVVHAIKGLDHKLLPSSQFCSFGMVTVAALRKPRLDSEGYYRFQDDRELMAAKVDAIFRVALMHGHDSLVLGALGCGVFRNPPKEVAAMFQQCIKKYGHFFKRIGFAILVVKPVDRENHNVFNELNSFNSFNSFNETAENV